MYVCMYVGRYVCMYVCIYIYIYIYTYRLKIHQRRVQWKQGVVNYMMLYTSLVSDTAPIHRTPLPLHPPVMNTQVPGSQKSA